MQTASSFPPPETLLDLMPGTATVSLSLPAGFSRKGARVRVLQEGRGSEMTQRNNALVLE